MNVSHLLRMSAAAAFTSAALALSTGAAHADIPVDERDMQKYCVGMASEKLSVRPPEISTLPVERHNGKYLVYGQTPTTGQHVTTFTCHYDENRFFRKVEVTSSAHKSDTETGAPTHEAKSACLKRMGGGARITTTNGLKPGYWELVVDDGTHRAACTVKKDGTIEDWVKM